MIKERFSALRLNQIILLGSIVVCAALFIGNMFSGPQKDTLYQVSTLSALMKGDYGAHSDLRSLRQKGDFGIGTFDHIDGELIELDGRFFQVRSDGVVNSMTDSDKTPFSMVTYFSPDKTIMLNAPLKLEELTRLIDYQIPTKNIVYAIRITGRFRKVKTRSVPRQEEPYRALADVIKDQSVFDLKDVNGTIIAFRMPEFSQGINVPGYHMHFLSVDRKSGGHLLDCEIISGRVEIDNTNQIEVYLPKDPAFYAMDLSQGPAASASKPATE